MRNNKKYQPKWWRSVMDFREGVRLLENVYKEVMVERFGIRIKYVKFLSCKDEKKLKRYLKVCVSVLKNLMEFCDDKVLTERSLKELLEDYVRVVSDWYGKYFTFLRLNTDTGVEIFERWVIEKYGSVERYIELLGRGNDYKKRDIESKNRVRESDLKKVGENLFEL